MLPINYLSVIVSAVVAFIIGFLMHGPVLGKLWMRLANVHPTGNEKFSDMYGQMAWNLIANIVTAYVLAVIYLLVSTSPFMSMSAISNGLICAFLVWIGFIVTGSSMEVIWMKRSFKLWIFECFSSLLTLLAMGAIIAMW